MAHPAPLRTFLCGILLTLVASCGGDAPSGPGGASGDDTAALSTASPDVQSLQIVSVGIRGATVATPTVEGRFDAQTILGARLDDTTLAFVVPSVTGGPHDVRFTVGGTTFTTTLQVAAAPAVADPDTYLAGLIASLRERADSIDQRLALATAATPASDTAGMAEVAVRLRWAADSASTIVAGMSAADRAAAATYLQVNSIPSVYDGASATRMALAASGSGCNGGTTAECNAELRARWDEIKVKIAVCTVSAVKFAAVGAAAGGGLGSLFAGIGAVPGAALGAVLGAAGGAGLCIWDINDSAISTILEPAVTHLKQAIALDSRVSASVAPGTVVYRVKSPKKVQVTAEVRSLIASDVSEDGDVGAIARTVAECTSLWRALMEATGLSLSGPVLPQSPAYSELRDMPASQLKIGSISLSGATATTAGDDTSFVVTFANDAQGADHEFSYAVRYEPAGSAAEEVVLQGVLRPEVYVVAGLQIDSAPPEMRVGQSAAQLYWTARDSSGAYLGATGVDSLLDGRVPEWSSSKPGVASVDAGGLVTAHDTGTVSITATLEQGSATVTFTVYPNVVGSWTLRTLNGRAVPYAEDDSTGTTNVLGGTIAISADGTFTFGYSETYTNKYTNIVYDEGASGSGTYTLSGNSIVFTILEKSGDKVEELVGAGFSSAGLTVTYSGSGGAAVGVLTKN